MRELDAETTRIVDGTRPEDRKVLLAEWKRCTAPILRGTLMTAALVVFVDVMKELPATLILRPFNFDTLATYVYQFASDEMLAQSALPALVIVLAGIVPIILMSRSIANTRSIG